MKKHNIEHDLFKILKSKNSNEIYYAILNMVNNTYTYEYRYLNNVSYDELMVYLEKIIVIGSKCTKFDSLEDVITAILKFTQNLNKLSIRYMRANVALNISYKLKVLETKIKAKSIGLKLSSVFLATIIFLSMYNQYLKTVDNENSDDISLGVEQGVELSDTLNSTDTLIAYDDSTKTTINSELSVEEKIDIILEKFNLTLEQFDVLCAIAITEAKPNSYEDTYAVINTIYNRTITQSWVNDINKSYDMDVGGNLYYQAIHPNQFVVYQNGNYANNLNVREGEQFQAIIDFLYNVEIRHEYLSFRSSNTELDFDYEQFVTNGNKYFNRIREEDRIIQDELTDKNTR